MAPLVSIQSSGDYHADRRYGWALASLRKGDYAGAADLAEQALELAPLYAPAYVLLGQAKAMLKRPNAAIAAFRRALEIEPEDGLGVRFELARLGALDPKQAITPGYVRTLFDNYAGTFDKQLVKHLHYRAPELLLVAVRQVLARDGRKLWFERAIDLGCGTGLVAKAFAGAFAAMDGVDLSPRMLAKARRGRLYARLHEGELVPFLKGESEASADLVIAADVFVYMAALDEVFRETRRVLIPGGLFSFTVQAHDGDGAVLGADQRFAHGEGYLRDLAAMMGFDLALFERVSTRQEQDIDVPGFLLVLER